MDRRELVSTDPRICHGRPVFTGTRIPVSLVLDNLAAGSTRDEILESYPSLTARHLQAAVSFAATFTRTDDETAWITELEKRAADLESGTVVGVPWAEVRRRLLGHRGFGMDRGRFEIPGDFDAPLPEDVLRDFEE
jgi:uncharacterized protein (DUF433 family)